MLQMERENNVALMHVQRGETLLLSLRAIHQDDIGEKHASRRFNDRDRRTANEPRDLNMTGAKNNQDFLDANER